MEKIEKLPTDTDVILDVFELTKVRHQQPIQDWISATGKLTNSQQELLNDIYQNSFNQVGWLERRRGKDEIN